MNLKLKQICTDCEEPGHRLLNTLMTGIFSTRIGSQPRSFAQIFTFEFRHDPFEIIVTRLKSM